jgi:hypothetical protein
LKYSNFINNLNKRDKILIFLLVPLLFIVIFLLLNQYIIPEQNKNIIQTISQYKLKINNINAYSNKTSTLNVIKYTQDMAIKFDIKIIHFNFTKNNSKLELEGKFQNILLFLINLEYNIDIKYLEFYINNKKFNANISFSNAIISFKKYAKKIEIIPNPFITQISHKSAKSLKLLAIFNQEVCINDIWYKKGDKIKGYILKYIFKDSVVLKKKVKTLTLKIRIDDK